MVGKGLAWWVGAELARGGKAGVLFPECIHVGWVDRGSLHVCTGEGGVKGGFRGMACFGDHVLVCGRYGAGNVGIG